ncbi:lytic transglycosylase domain-containing protein [Hasllibacter halocynthiae]|nr:lytic transglycosylase domain-containing protein [Hasllibacter halocynthiae]
MDAISTGKALALAVVLGASSPGPLGAEPSAFPEFSARRVGLPAAGVARRITVQIVPAPPEAAAPAPAAPAPSRQQAAGWFWTAVDPARAATAGRFDAAVRAVEGGPLRAPSAQALGRMAAAHGGPLLLHSAGTRVSPALALAVMATESAGRAEAVSGAGAQGLMQLIPATAERFGVADPFDPSENVRGGIAYLDWLMRRFDGDAVLALAAYNAGEGAVDDHGGVPPFAETRTYVPKVLAAWRVARLLCATPPELPSDGCAFVVPVSGG